MEFKYLAYLNLLNYYTFSYFLYINTIIVFIHFDYKIVPIFIYNWMGNCTKPRTNSNENIRAQAPSNAPGNNRPPPPNLQNNIISSPNNPIPAVQNRSNLLPNPYQNNPPFIPNPIPQPLPVPNRNLVQNIAYPQSNYPPAAYNMVFNGYRGQYNPSAPSPIYQPNYHISNIPLSNPRASQISAPNVEGSLAIHRFSRLIDDTVSLIEESKNEYWINFKYSTKYSTTISIYCFARENFNNEKNTLFYTIDEKNINQPKQFNVSPQSDGQFLNQYKINIQGIPQANLEITDRCTYPIVIELQTKSDESQSQTLISFFKITREHNILSATIVKQTIKINNKYRELLNIFGNGGTDQELECLICLSELRTIAVLPCRHACFCEACVEEVKKNHKLDCPVCRSKITSFINIKHS